MEKDDRNVNVENDFVTFDTNNFFSISGDSELICMVMINKFLL